MVQTSKNVGTATSTTQACIALVLGGCALPIEDSPTVVWPPIPDSGETTGSATDRQRLRAARAAFDLLRAAPNRLERILWYGRRLAYLGHYPLAIDVYSLGLSLRPDAPRLLRHRGHRYITTRRFAEAVADLERAGRLIRGQPDEIEPDGIPNARNTPTSTLHTNIWYHLGLARYCRGEFSAALRCYDRCLEAARNPDMEAATRYWIYLTAQRLGDDSRAAAAIAPVTKDWDIIENHAYHRLLLLFKGQLTLEALQQSEDDAIKNFTTAYGLLRYHIARGDETAAKALRKSLLAADSPAFGCIAARADRARAEVPRDR